MSEPAQPNLLNMLLLFAAFGLFFWALIIRPQQRREKEHREMLAQVQKGDQVVTSGGVHGKVTGVTDEVLTVEIANGVRIKVDKASIGRRTRSEGDKT